MLESSGLGSYLEIGILCAFRWTPTEPANFKGGGKAPLSRNSLPGNAAKQVSAGAASTAGNQLPQDEKQAGRTRR